MNIKLLAAGLFVLLALGFHVYLDIHNVMQIDELEAQLAACQKELVIQQGINITLNEKRDRYEDIIYDMMQGQWEPNMGIRKEFVEDWYGTEIWSFKAVNRPPGSPNTDVGEVIDRKLEGE